MADALGGELIERDAVAKAAALGMRGAGEEALFRGMSPVTPGWLTPEKTVILSRTRASFSR